MKKLTAMTAAAALAASVAGGAMAEETIKPLEQTTTKSSQASLPLLTGLGAGAGAGALIIGAIAVVTVVAATSGT